ncbi:MAG: type IX secretion system membrane protein PorP/SprF, partial [Bacteroidota bacterium]|nr:type IX secretion system membrane protein PorP/SprF [Bacteroidota bacterium]
EIQAQSRKYIASFSQVQHYFNPALTSLNGSQLKTFYRDQWTGFEDAPRTLFFSSEFDLADVGAWSRSKRPGVLQEERPDPYLGAKDAIGVTLLHDSFGPYRENQLFLSYSRQVQLSQKLTLRAGAAVTYNNIFLDYLQLTLDQSNDPELQNLIEADNNEINKVDVNVGVALAGQNFYVGYALQDAAQGKLTSNENYFMNTFPLQHNVQAGYRHGFSEQFGLTVNGLFRYDNKLKETIEGQVKGVFQNTFWAGGGYRYNQAYTFTAGFRLKQILFNYTFESVTQESRRINASSNEIALTYNLVPLQFKKLGKKMLVW